MSDEQFTCDSPQQTEHAGKSLLSEPRGTRHAHREADDVPEKIVLRAEEGL